MSRAHIFGSKETFDAESKVLLTKAVGPHRDGSLSTLEYDNQEGSYTDRNESAPTFYDRYAGDVPRAGFHRLNSDSSSVQRPNGVIRVWGYIVFPLVSHFCLAVGILCMLLFGINNRTFNITDRMPTVTLLNGAKVEVEGVKFNLLQSDITTILSFLLAILRLLSTMWCGALCWRVALILMEKSGMTVRELNWLASIGLPPISITLRPRESGGGYMLGLSAILVFIWPVPLGAPLITGSITWSPTSINYPARNMTIPSKNWDGHEHLGLLQPMKPIPAADVPVSTAMGFYAWGSSNETGVMRRTLTDPSAITLPVNTTLNNITVPYFEITKLDWLKDPESLLTPRQLGAIDPTNSTYWLNVSSSENPMFNDHGYNAALIHDQDLSSRIGTGESWAVSRTALLVYLAGSSLMYGDAKCGWGSSNTKPPSTIQPDATLVRRRIDEMRYRTEYCFAFANVTYTAGSADCRPCRMSSPLSVQSDASLQAKNDISTRYAMLLMPQVAFQIREYQEGAHLPQSEWNTLDQYITCQLQQTYSAIWSYLVEHFASNKQTKVTLPIPALLGLVSTKRVWIWFALQMTVTISGIAFIMIQVHVDRCPIQNVTLLPLFIDTSSINSNDDSLHTIMSNEGKGVLRLRRVQGELLSRAAYAHPNSK